MKKEIKREKKSRKPIIFAVVGAAIVITSAVAIPFILSSQNIINLQTTTSIETPNITFAEEPPANQDVVIDKYSSKQIFDLSVAVKFNNNDYSKPVTYQWYEKTDIEDIKLNGENRPTLSIDIKKINKSITKKYFCIVGWNGITKQTRISTLNIILPNWDLKITSQPQSVTGASSGHTLNVGATVTSPIAGKSIQYQWYLVTNNENILLTGENKNTLSINLYGEELITGEIRQYFCKLTYDTVSINSSIATVQFAKPTIIITQQPFNTFVGNDKTATLSVTASSSIVVPSIPLKYQWYRKDSDKDVLLPYQTNSSLRLTFTDAELSSKKVLSYYCKINLGGYVTRNSDIATVTISSTKINISSQPQDITYSPSATFKVVANVTDPMTGVNLEYQWYEEESGGTFTKLIGKTSNVLQLSTIGLDLSRERTVKYFCRLTYGGISIDTAKAVLTIPKPAPVSNIQITKQPVNVPKAISSSSFSITATPIKTEPGAIFSYQWYEVINGVDTPVAGAIDSIMPFTKIGTKLNTPQVLTFFCKITYGTSTLNSSKVTATVLGGSTTALNTAMNSFNNKTVVEKANLYNNLFTNKNVDYINKEITNFNRSWRFYKLTNNMNINATQLNVLKEVLKTPSNYQLTNFNATLMDFDKSNTSAKATSIKDVKINPNTYYDFSQLNINAISNLTLSYDGTWFVINIQLKDTKQIACKYIVGSSVTTYYYKQNVILEGSVAPMADGLIQTNILDI